MILKEWNKLPQFMQCDEVWEYYEILRKKRGNLILKKIFDIIMAGFLIIVFTIPMLVIAILIKMDSKGPVFYRQERITTYGKKFKIHKFRTMVNNADKIGSEVTAHEDSRITKIGRKIRKYRIDEIPQLLDVLQGNMSFVGTRPEATRYVEQYSREMFATLLLPAGITSETSIKYKNEAEKLKDKKNIDIIYVNEILPEKMKYNLESIGNFSFIMDIKIMLETIVMVLKK